MSDAVPSPFETLSTAGQLVAQAYGAAAPCSMGVQRVQRAMSRAGMRLNGRSVDAGCVRRCNGELIEAGFAERTDAGGGSGGGVRAVPAWSLVLARIAHARGHLAPLRKQVCMLLGPYHPLVLEVRLRCGVVSGNFEALAGLEERAGDLDWSFLAEPLADDLLRELPDRFRGHALEACLEHVIESCAAAEATISIVRELSPAPEIHAADIAFIRVLQGRFDSALAEFDRLAPEGRGAKTTATGLAATRALAALLHGDDETARRHIEESLAGERAGTRKRLVFPDSKAFAWSLLALVREDTVDSLELLGRVFRGAELNANRHYRDLTWVLHAARAKAREWIGRRLSRPPGLPDLMDGLLNCWLKDEPGGPSNRRPLEALRRRAEANGFGWVAAECDELLRLRSPSPPLAGRGQPALPLSTSRVGEGGGGRGHEELGTATLVGLAAPAPEWERALKALESVAQSVGGARRRSAGERRLAWEIGDAGYGVTLHAREQRRYKNGGWSRGRRVAAKRLAAMPVEEDFLLPADRKAIAAATFEDPWTGRLKHSPGLASLYELAGHPHVFNGEGEPVDVVPRPPELTIDEDAEGRSVVRLEPRDLDLEDDFAVTMIGQRCEVTRFSAEHRPLLDAVPEEGLVVPAEAKSRLLAAASSLAASVRVQGDSLDGAANAARVEADPRPWVRLEPLGAGLTVSLVVEPIPGSDAYFAPGEGGANVLTWLDGAPVQARRDLEAERLAVERLTAHCPALASRPTQLEALAVPAPGDCLELLDRLASAGARCKWPKGEPFRIVARASNASLSLHLKSATDWLKASGRLAIDEERVVELKRLFELLDERPGSRFLALGEGEFVALTDALRRQLDDFASLTTPAAGGSVRLHPFAAPVLDELFEGAQVEADEAWRDLRARIAAAESFEPEPPSTLRAELRPYQREGYSWLARLAQWGAGACLADDMGLGKTVQTLAVLVRRAPDGPALVVAPTSVVANWVDEARRFAPTLNVRVYAGPASSRAGALDAPGPFDLFITTYGLLQKDVDSLAAVSWHSVALDEAQAIKNPAAKRSRAARRLTAGFRLVTTGTPIQNNLMDLHSLFGFINPGLLGSMQSFRREFALPVERDRDDAARARLRRLIAPFVLRRLKTDVLDDLPERTEITLHVTMSSKEAALYESLRQRAVEEIEAARDGGADLGEGPSRVRVLAHLTRLRLACCHPRLVLEAEEMPSSKLAAFAETLAELLGNRHKVLVFSQFVKHLKLIEEYLKSADVSYQYLDGATPAQVRFRRIAAFQAGRGDVFLISLKAGGVGLNLTAADYVIHMDPWWNPAVEDQASDRAHRIGQNRPVTIYRLVTEGTIEEQIVDLHRHKRDLADRLLEGASAAGRLSAGELLDLIRRPGAIHRRSVAESK